MTRSYSVLVLKECYTKFALHFYNMVELNEQFSFWIVGSLARDLGVLC